VINLSASTVEAAARALYKQCHDWADDRPWRALPESRRRAYRGIAEQALTAAQHAREPEQRLNAVVAQRRRDLDLALHGKADAR